MFSRLVPVPPLKKQKLYIHKNSKDRISSIINIKEVLRGVVMKHKHKKGSMELGINAIVVIVIALALLGLGIGFVTRLFGGASKNFGEIINNNELEFHADAMNPIKFNVKEIDVKQGDSSPITVSIYNSGTFAEGSKIALRISECVDSAGVIYSDSCDYPDHIGDDPAPPVCHLSVSRMAAPSQKISRGTDGGYRAIISVPKDFYGFRTLQQLKDGQWVPNDDAETGASEKVTLQTYTCTVEAFDDSANANVASTQLYVKVIV
jgi:hypothetical protein